MKTITRIFAATAFLFAAVSTINAQSTVDWEDAPFGVGYDYALEQFENGPYPQDGANLFITNNPDATGINTTPKCLKMNILDIGQPWAGFWFTNSLKDASTPFTLTEENCIIKMMVYKPIISTIAFKIEDFSDGSKYGILYIGNTKINEWEEITFDFSAFVGQTFHKVVIMPDSPVSRTAGCVCYVDEISFNAVSTGLKNTNSSEFSMFLNKTTGKLQLNSALGIQEATIRGLNGQSLKTATINSLSGEIDMSDLPTGNYLVSTKLNDGQLFTQKMAKY